MLMLEEKYISPSFLDEFQKVSLTEALEKLTELRPMNCKLSPCMSWLVKESGNILDQLLVKIAN